MKITLVNTHDLIGGAERCSYDLATQLIARGELVTLVVGGKLGSDDFVKKMHYRYFDYKFREFVHKILGLTDTVLIAPILKCLFGKEFKNADVFNVHNMHGEYWNFWTLPILARYAPIVITLHDEWFLTGDCAYTYECEKWMSSCGNCPQAKVLPVINRYAIGGKDLTRINLFLKRISTKLIPKNKITIVCPSTWLLNKALKAKHLRKFDFEKIEYGIDLSVFRPMDMNESRKHFKLPLEKFLIFAPATNINDRRKNIKLVFDLIKNTSLHKDILIICTGDEPESELNLLEDSPIRYVGYQSKKEQMAKLYSACNVNMALSLADNLPYTIIEALACGCPTIGTRVGGIPEIIKDNKTGWVVPDNCTVDLLLSKINEIYSISKNKHKDIRTAARDDALLRFSTDDFIRKYQELYQRKITECA